jgi:hypothetical protein
MGNEHPVQVMARRQVSGPLLRLHMVPALLDHNRVLTALSHPPHNRLAFLLVHVPNHAVILRRLMMLILLEYLTKNQRILLKITQPLPQLRCVDRRLVGKAFLAIAHFDLVHCLNFTLSITFVILYLFFTGWDSTY